MASITVLSNAKINLFFEIHALRPDHYCQVTSLMAPINLCDQIKFTITENAAPNIYIASQVPFDKQQNTIIQSIELFFQHARIDKFSVEVEIEKNIPDGAGFGGGSSNGTHTLMTLNQFFGNQIPTTKLLSIAKKIGTDCPFFLNRFAQLATGRGDELLPIPEIDTKLKNYHCLIFCPEFKISTIEAYRDFKLHPHFSTNFIDFDPQLRDLESCCFNSFEPQILSQHSELNALFSALKKEQLSPHITGSGSGCFILHKSRIRLKTAQNLIQKYLPNNRLCRIVSFG